MPNHCNNQLTLESGENIENVLSPYLIESGQNDGYFTLDFQSIIPMPKELLEEEGEGWYSWRLDNWGTKWEGYDGRFNCDDFSSFIFDTAWSPPLPIIKRLAELTGQTFILEYIEYGMFYCGKYVADPEAQYDEFYDDIKNAPKELLESLGYEPMEEGVW